MFLETDKFTKTYNSATQIKFLFEIFWINSVLVKFQMLESGIHNKLFVYKLTNGNGKYVPWTACCKSWCILKFYDKNYNFKIIIVC